MSDEIAIERYNTGGVAVAKYMSTHTSAESPSKNPIIMVHGGIHSGWEWHYWARFFADAGYEVHVLDWYNHGNSERVPEEKFLRRGMVDVANEEITRVAEGVTRTPIVIGHSMGALASAVYTTTATVEKLVLVTPVLPAGVGAAQIPLPIDFTAPFPGFPFEQAKQLFFTCMSEDEAKHYYNRLEPESPQAVWDATRCTVTADFAAITVPTLVLAAASDQLISAEPLKRFAGLINAEFVEAAGTGHSDVLLKTPEWTFAARHVLDWLESPVPH